MCGYHSELNLKFDYIKVFPQIIEDYYNFIIPFHLVPSVCEWSSQLFPLIFPEGQFGVYKVYQYLQKYDPSNWNYHNRNLTFTLTPEFMSSFVLDSRFEQLGIMKSNNEYNININNVELLYYKWWNQVQDKRNQYSDSVREVTNDFLIPSLSDIIVDYCNLQDIE